MGQLFEIVKEFFMDEKWRSSQLESQTILKMLARTQDEEWTCFAEAKEKYEEFVFYSVVPVCVPEAQRSVISEFLTRANYGLGLGNFEMDWEDGEIRFKTSIDIEGSQLTHALLRPLVYRNVSTMGKYLPGIRAVLNGELTARASIAKIEA
jgi:hypothetical protein